LGIKPEDPPAQSSVQTEAPTQTTEAAPGSSNEAVSAFSEELPPDFWDDAELPEASAGDSENLGAEHLPRLPAARHEVAGRLEDDPRFALMQQLFPGRITDWQETAQKGADDGADDEGEEAETVDLEVDR